MENKAYFLVSNKDPSFGVNYVAFENGLPSVMYGTSGLQAALKADWDDLDAMLNGLLYAESTLVEVPIEVMEEQMRQEELAIIH